MPPLASPIPKAMTSKLFVSGSEDKTGDIPVDTKPIENGGLGAQGEGTDAARA